VVADPVDPDSSNAGAGDPLAQRAVSAYRQRLGRWLQKRFVVTDSGLSSEVLGNAKVQAKIEIDEELRVVGYEIEPGAPEAMAAAAKRALEQVVGQTVPPLPEYYPGPLQRWVRVTFVCTEDACN
jgi:hypothetical protein